MSRLSECGFNTVPFLTEEKSAESFTSTAANTYAELAKLLYEKFENAQETASAVSETHCLIGSDKPLNGRQGKTAEEIQGMFVDGSKNIILLKAFCAWMREGIKAKEKLNEAIDSYETPKYIDAHRDYLAVEVPESEKETLNSLKKRLEELEQDKELEKAELDYETVPGVKRISEEDVKSQLNVKLMFDLLYSEAATSVYGKAVHKGGHLKHIKEDIMNATMNPINLNGLGASTVAVTKTPSMSVSEVEALEMKLQGLHREHQTKFNSIMRTEVTDKVTLYNLSELVRYEKERKVAADRLLAIRTPIDEEKAQLRAAIRDEEKRIRELGRKLRTEAKHRMELAQSENVLIREQLHKEAKDLRIILPHDLKEVYEQIKLASKQA